MKAFELFESIYLAENKSEYLVKTMGEKLVKAYEEDTRKELSAEKVIAKLAKIDPTPKQDFLVYITNMYVKGQFKMEDAARFKGDLQTFVKVRSKLANKDISSYKTLDALYDAIEQFSDVDEKDLMSNNAKDRELKKGAKYVINTPDFKVLIPTTREAACFYGAGTKWCTAAENNNQFDNYHSRGSLYIIIAKDKNGKDRKFQLHYEDGQFMNERDQELSSADIAFLSGFDEYTKFLNMMIKKHYIDA